MRVSVRTHHIKAADVAEIGDFAKIVGIKLRGGHKHPAPDGRPSAALVRPGEPARIFESPFSGNNPGKTGIYRMYSLKSKILTAILCALAAAIVLYSSVCLSIDAASLSAEMPIK
jgi:hypothetical protein